MEAMLSTIQHNLEILVSAYEGQKRHAANLQAEVEKYRNQLQSAKEKIYKLEEEIGILKERTVFLPSTPDNYTTAKASVDALIKEIDEALALLQ